MTMPLHRLIRDPGADVFYTPEWQLMIETHLPLILARSDNAILSCSPAQAYKYEGDLAGLLTELNVNPCYHWLLMRMNNMRTWTDYDGVKTVLVIPNYTFISRLTEVHKTTMTKIR